MGSHELWVDERLSKTLKSPDAKHLMTHAIRYATLVASFLLAACDAPLSRPEPSEPPVKLNLELDWNAIDKMVATTAGDARGSALMAAS